MVCERREVPLDRLMRALPVVLVAAGLGAASCGEGSKGPTPTEQRSDIAALIPVAPAPQPTATPTPGTTPDEEPLPATPALPGGGGGGTSAGCGPPAPPALSRMTISVYGRAGNSALLDSTPLVGPDGDYCRQVGFTDGRLFCAVRPDGHPERVACEAAVVGRASDTGRAGPTWSADGKPCNGPEGGTSCLNHPENQYMAYAYGAGAFRACAADGVCGEIALP